jgi:hypothetical protein
MSRAMAEPGARGQATGVYMGVHDDYSPHPWGSPLRGQPAAVQNRSWRFCVEPPRNAAMASAVIFKTGSKDVPQEGLQG